MRRQYRHTRACVNMTMNFKTDQSDNQVLSVHCTHHTCVTTYLQSEKQNNVICMCVKFPSAEYTYAQLHVYSTFMKSNIFTEYNIYYTGFSFKTYQFYNEQRMHTYKNNNDL